MKTFDILKKATLTTMGANEENQHRLVGDRGFAQDVVRVFFKDYHMHITPKDCSQELRLEFENAESERKVVVLGAASDGYLTFIEH